MPKLTREELIELVSHIVTADGTEAEVDQMIQLLCESVPHPRVTDLIYYSGKPLTPEEIVDRALSHKAIQL